MAKQPTISQASAPRGRIFATTVEDVQVAPKVSVLSAKTRAEQEAGRARLTAHQAAEGK